MFISRSRWAPIFATAGVLGMLVLAAGADEQGFVPLGNGKDMSPFDLVGTPESTWTVEGDVIKCSGKPLGYCATKKSYQNYVLRFDVKFVRPENLKDDASFGGNSGILLHMTGKPAYGPGRAFPKCIEVQGMNRELGRTFGVATKQPKSKDDPAARRKTLKPVGEWNAVEIVSQDGAVTATINGTKVCETGPFDLKQGPIGFQSEGSEIHFRNLRIKES